MTEKDKEQETKAVAKVNGDEIEVQTVDLGVALTAAERAGLDVQVTTAKQYPRSITDALRTAEDLATLDEDTAMGCFYLIPRAGKKIEGPSARLAEIMAYSWGNLRCDAAVVGDDATHITAVGTTFDLERNVAIRVQVKRRITNAQGKRFNEDMVTVAGNAAISIALRNSVFKVIPAALTQKVYQAARKASVGEAGTLTQKRQNALAWFAKTGIPEAEVFKMLEVKGVDDIGVDELITLRGISTALKDGDTTVESLLAHGSEGAELGTRTQEAADALKKKLAEKNGEKKEEEPAVPGKEADTLAHELELLLKEKMPKDVRAHFKKQLKALHKAGDMDGLNALSVKIEREVEKQKKAARTDTP